MKNNKMKNHILLNLIFIFFISLALQGQEKKENAFWNMGFDGMLASSFSKDLVAFNIGGPSFFWVLNEKIKVGISALPSMVILNNKLGVRLGVSPRIDFKKWVLLMPLYQDKTENWIWTFGLGYKFNYKK